MRFLIPVLFVGLVLGKHCLAFQILSIAMRKLTAFFPTLRNNKRGHSLLLAGADDSMAKRSSSPSLSSSNSYENKRGKVDAVDALLSSLTSKTWSSALDEHFNTSSFRNLAEFVEKERRSHTVYPPASYVWTALNSCEIDDIKVVIVGQDPYHGPNQAHGLSFSVLPSEQPPPSLKNVFKELSQDADVDFQMPGNGYLIHWAKQGVLLLNAVMTVRQGEANSHKNKGWEAVTDEIIKAVDRKARENRKGVVFLLWGNPAAKKALQLIDDKSDRVHKIICTSHPSPLGATKTTSPFLGSQCFSRCNTALEQMGRATIDWNLHVKAC